MHLAQIDRLTATVPPAIDEPQRARLRAYKDTARRCELRIKALRREIERELQVASADGGPEPSEASDYNAVLILACELHTLEQVQPRVDAWLKEWVAALIVQHSPPTYTGAESYGDAGPL